MKFYDSHPRITSAWVGPALMYSSPVNESELTNWKRVSFGGLKNGLHVSCTELALLPYRCYAVVEKRPEIDKMPQKIESPNRAENQGEVDRALILRRCYCSSRWCIPVYLSGSVVRSRLATCYLQVRVVAVEAFVEAFHGSE